MTTPDQSTLCRYMALVMLVGAANADADPTQRAMMRERVMPPLRDKNLSGHEARKQACEALLDIMGEDWEPVGEWAQVLTSIVRDLEAGQ